MGGYWARHRLLPSLIMAIVVAALTGFLFAFPFVEQCASSYNAQSIYENSDIDFIAPEPSFEQVAELPGTKGISKVFPFYLTKTGVNVNGVSRTTTVLLSDQFDNVDMTMYNDSRLIRKADLAVDNPIYIDWQFSHDTSAGIGDAVSFSIGGNNVDFTIVAIYETNSVYDGGAILAEISSEQKNTIAANSKSNGFSAIYISASDYNACRTYLTTEYRPLGRLRERSQFDSDEQYAIHYDAIMSSGYANEITDFRVKENDLDTAQNPLMVIIGAVLAAVAVLAFSIIMSRRGSEKGYFTKFCIPKGQNVRPYYTISFGFELFSFLVLYVGSICVRVITANEYLPRGVFGVLLIVIPVAFAVAEVVALRLNNSMIAVITTKVRKEEETKKATEAEVIEKARIESVSKNKH